VTETHLGRERELEKGHRRELSKGLGGGKRNYLFIVLSLYFEREIKGDVR
jgi:hypothetical protein